MLALENCFEAHCVKEGRDARSKGRGALPESAPEGGGESSFSKPRSTCCRTWFRVQRLGQWGAARRWNDAPAGNGHLKPSRPGPVPARPFFCTRHVREPLRFLKSQMTRAHGCGSILDSPSSPSRSSAQPGVAVDRAQQSRAVAALLLLLYYSWHRVERYKSLRALNTSPSWNCTLFNEAPTAQID